jgi:glycosyltransferase involved in cell wall biosynthesis
VKIAYLCSDFGVPVLGSKGCSVHVREISRALRELGHEVRIYAPEPGADEVVAREAGVYRVPLGGLARTAARLLNREEVGVPPHLFRELRRLLYSEQLRAKLRPLLEEFRPDAIYERYTLFGYAGVEIAEELDIPILLEVNAPLAQEGARRRGWVLGQTAGEMEAEILRRADVVLAVSQAVVDHARTLGVPPERVAHVPNGVDPGRFDPATSGDAVRREYGLHGEPVIGYVGSLRVWHDLDTVLDAVDRLSQVDPSVRFLAVGPGEHLEEMEARGGGRVICPGAVPHERVPEFIAAMDVAIVPFGGEEEYFSPLKLFEFMAMGKPIVGARMGQVTELIVPDETGLLYDPGDADNLASCIRHILSRPDRGKSLGAAARERVVAGHSWTARAERITELARQLRSPVPVG